MEHTHNHQHTISKPSDINRFFIIGIVLIMDSIQNLPKIKATLKEELEEHNIKHSTLEFELVSEQCKDIEQ